MKYNIVINQKAIMENNLSIIEYAILDVISTAPTWCSDITINNIVYYWVARQKLAEELKSFNLKPDTVYRHLKKLTEKGFLNYTKHGKKDCINLTTKSKKMFSSTMSETNPNYYVGNKSEKNSETNPTYNNTKEDNYTYIQSFEKLWANYGRIGSKATAKRKYLSKSFTYSAKEVSIAISRYLPTVKDKKFQKHFSTFLNNISDYLEDYEEINNNSQNCDAVSVLGGTSDMVDPLSIPGMDMSYDPIFGGL